MINQKVNFENPETEIKCEFGEAIRELQISKLLTPVIVFLTMQALTG